MTKNGTYITDLLKRRAELLKTAADLLKDLVYVQAEIDHYTCAETRPPSGIQIQQQSNPSECAHLKKADAIEMILRKNGSFMYAAELCKALREGGCKMPDNPTRDWQVVSVVLSSKAHEGRFVVEGNRIGLPEFVTVAQTRAGHDHSDSFAHRSIS